MCRWARDQGVGPRACGMAAPPSLASAVKPHPSFETHAIPPSILLPLFFSRTPSLLEVCVCAPIAPIFQISSKLHANSMTPLVP